METADVKQFFNDPGLTGAEAARFAELGDECGASDG